MPLTRNNFLRRPSKVKERRSQRHGVRNAIYSVNGDKYKGEWKDDKRHGMGQQVWKSGATYIGDWKCGKPDGYGTYTKGEQLYIGEWKDGKKHGHGKCAYNELAFYHGEWKEGHRNGWGEMHYENGDVYVGDWLMDKRNGEGIIRYVGGDWYEGEWKSDVKHGEGKLYFAEKDQLYYGTWFNGEARRGTLSDYDKDEDGSSTALTDESIKEEEPEVSISALEVPSFITNKEQGGADVEGSEGQIAAASKMPTDSMDDLQDKDREGPQQSVPDDDSGAET